MVLGGSYLGDLFSSHTYCRDGWINRKICSTPT